MLPNSELLLLAKSAESQYLERKKACPEGGELRATLCAFANSTPEGQISVLFLGIEDNGTICGVPADTVDGTQKKIIKVARDDCYPPINAVPQVIETDGKTLIAVMVEHSKDTPHFVGPSYVRIGPTSVKASSEQFEELVAIRNSVVGRLLREKRKGSVVKIRWVPPRNMAALPERFHVFNHVYYRIEDCDPFVVKVQSSQTMKSYAVPIDAVKISYSVADHLTLLYFDAEFPG